MPTEEEKNQQTKLYFNGKEISTEPIYTIEPNTNNKNRKKELNMTNNNLMIFNNNEFGEVRTIKDKNENIYFVAKDVSKCLGYKKLDNMYKRLNNNQKLKVNPQSIEKAGFLHEVGIQLEPNPNIKVMVLITEGGLYKAVLGSKLKEAEKFQDWVVEEVLPSIRKHGAYMTPETLKQAMGDPDFLIGILEGLKEEQEKNKILSNKNFELTMENEELEIEVERFTNLFDMRDLYSFAEIAQFIQTGTYRLPNGKAIGRNNLMGFFRERKILKADNTPYQRYMKYFEVKVVESETTNGRVTKNKQTFVKYESIRWILGLLEEIA